MSVIRSCLLPTESVIVWSAQRAKWGVVVTSIQSPVLVVLLCNTDLSVPPWINKIPTLCHGINFVCNYIHF